MSELACVMIEAEDVTPDLVRGLLLRDHVIEVRDRGKLVGGFLSQPELERYRELTSREVEVFVADSLPEEIVAALEDSLGKYGLGLE